MKRRAILQAVTLTAVEIFRNAYYAGRKPDPVLTVSEWADQNRQLSSVVASEPGRWRTSRTPYLREPMDCLSASSPVESVAFRKGAQIGGTEAGNNWIGYVIDQVPGPMIVVLPTDGTAKRWSKQRLKPLIADSPALRDKVKESRERDSGNTILAKEFSGGILIITGANSASGLRSMPARYMMFDEIDAYPQDADGEGDPIGLAEKRSLTFTRRKSLKISTPTDEATSRIDREFKAGDQRYYFVPCPLCEHYQFLKFGNLEYEPKGKPTRVAYRCESCGGQIEERWKTDLLERGAWVPTANAPELLDFGFGPERLEELAKAPDCRIASYHLSGLYSPIGWLSWLTICEQWVAAQTDQRLLKVFVNTVLGESWRERGDAPDWKKLFDRREGYQLSTVPAGALILTAGVDVQADRLEVQVIGNGRRDRTWLVDYLILDGDTSRQEVWDKLTNVLAIVYQNENGTDLTIRKMAIDSGFASQQVYAWGRKHRFGPVAIIKGGPASMTAVIGAASPVDITLNGKKLDAGVKVQLVNVSELKKQFYGWLHLELPNLEKGEEYGNGFFHFCSTPDTEEYCRQLAAEQLVTRTHRGYQKREWEKIRPRNEALDTWIYARAAALMLGVDRYKERHWARLEGATPTPEPVIAGSSPQEAEPVRSSMPKAARRVIRSSWMD